MSALDRFDTSEYEALLRAFLESRTSAEDHSDKFFKRFQSENDWPSEPIYQALNAHQCACDMFTRDSNLLTEPFFLDEAELRQDAALTLEVLLQAARK